MQKGRNHKQKRKPKSKPSHERSVSLEDTPISAFILRLQTLSRQTKQSGVLHVNSESVKRNIRDLVKVYFQGIRVDFIQHRLDTSTLDDHIQSLLSYANSRTKVSTYNLLFSTIEKNLKTLESQELIAESNKLVEARNLSSGLAVVGQDKKIIDVLSKILPAVTLSYQQVLTDISQPRLSYRGAAGELREILREVLDYLAPDVEVLKAPGFKLEKDRSGPTMKQKVRFILKNRNKSQSAIEVPENATVIVEESIAKLARATYNRGSLSTHTATEKTEVVNLKRYLDSVLCELLEIY